MMTNDDYIFRLQMLIERFLNLGVGADIAQVSLIEMWSLYLYLNRMAGG